MRILFITNFYPPAELGGYAQLCQEVVDGMKRKGHSVLVLTSKEVGIKIENDENGVCRVLNLEVDSRPYYGTIGFFFGREKRLQETISAFINTINNYHPNVVFFWGMWNLPKELPLISEKISSHQTVYYIADVWPTLNESYQLHWQEGARHSYTTFLKSTLKHLALKQLSPKRYGEDLRFPNAICVSNALKDFLIESGIPIKNAQVFFNGIDLTKFQPMEKDLHIDPNDQRLSLLYAGRLTKDKGIHIAIEALSVLAKRGHEFQLTVLGSGSKEYSALLKGLCKKFGIYNRVQFIDRIPRNLVPSVLQEHHVLVCPFISFDALPRITQEAMAVGLVVVGSNVGGLSEIIQNHKNGLLFEPGSVDGLVECIEELLDPKIFSSLAREGQNTVREKFDILKLVDNIDRFLNEVAGEKS